LRFFVAFFYCEFRSVCLDERERERERYLVGKRVRGRKNLRFALLRNPSEVSQANKAFQVGSVRCMNYQEEIERRDFEKREFVFGHVRNHEIAPRYIIYQNRRG